MEAEKKIAVVTGGNKGIGLEICKQLASNGVFVILTARDEKRGKEAVEKLTKDHGLENMIFHQLDVTDHSSIASLAGFVKKQFGKLDILVNNAAIGGFDIPVPIDEKLPQPERFAIFYNSARDNCEKAVDCFKTNYYGVKSTMQVFLPLLQLSAFGRIVNVSSRIAQLQFVNNEELREELMDIDNLTAERIDDLAKSFLNSVEDQTEENAKWATGGFTTYRVSKILMNAYSRIIAKCYPNVTINCVHPGPVNTDLSLNTGLLTISDGAEGPVMVALAEGGPTGQFYERTQISVF